jgi:hypothetical protein
LRRRELPADLGEVTRQDAESADGLGLADLRVRRVHRGLHLGAQLGIGALAALACAAGTSAGLAAAGGAVWTGAGVLTVALIIGRLLTGAVRAERARRYGCW